MKKMKLWKLKGITGAKSITFLENNDFWYFREISKFRILKNVENFEKNGRRDTPFFQNCTHHFFYSELRKRDVDYLPIIDNPHCKR